MWHEARKQEKKLRGLMVDFKRRAERRREFYERIKKDPHSFLRMYGQPVKIHLDPAVAAAAESPQSMMPWQGDKENMIDRFDVRANLDIIPTYDGSAMPDAEEVEDDLKCNYERYRCIVQNDCAGLSEEQVLRQIYVDEMFGDVTKNKEAEEEKKKTAEKKAAIGFKYEDSTPSKPDASAKASGPASESESDDTDVEDVDLDVAFDIDEISDEQKQLLNITALNYGISMGEYTEQLRKDKEEEQVLKEARAMEEEKAAFSGRKSRKERRIFKEQKVRDRQMSPPSYAQRESPKYNPYQKSSDSSRSPSPANARVTFITSFGEADATDQQQSKRAATQTSRKASGSGSSDHMRSDHSRWRRRSRSKSYSPTRKQSRTSQPTVLASSVNRRSSHRSPTGRRGRRSSSSRSRSRSRSRSLSVGHQRASQSRSARSRSRSKQKQPPSSSSHQTKSPTPKVFKRYRRPSLESKSSDDELSSDDDEPAGVGHKEMSQRSTPGNVLNRSATSSQASSMLTAKERLKRKMQAALNKQYKADKRVELEKKEKARQEKLDREDEMRARIDDYRRKEREKRYQEDSGSSRRRSTSRSPSRSSRSRSRSWSPKARHARSPVRSRSRSPPPRDRRYKYS